MEPLNGQIIQLIRDRGPLHGIDIMVLLRLRSGIDDGTTRTALIGLLRDQKLWMFEGKYQESKPKYPLAAAIEFDGEYAKMNKDFDQDDDDDDLSDDDLYGGWLHGGY